MKKAFIAAALVSASLSAQQPPAPAGQAPQAPPPLPVARVVVLDPALNKLVTPEAAIERWDYGFGFVEGPVWAKDGALLFSDVPGNTIFRSTGKQTTIFKKPSGYDGNDRRPGQQVGSNGLTIDRQGRVIATEHGHRRVSRIESNGRVTVLADKYDGKRLNSPNDVVVKSDGSIYFTDPPYGLLLNDKDPAKEIPFNSVFRIKEGKVDLLNSDLARPNGLAFTPDERALIVANADPMRRALMRYEVRPDGTLGPGSVLIDFSKEPLMGTPDGLKIDTLGNIYTTGPGGLWILSPEGKPLGRIELPEQPANVAFGDADGKMLYMTARTSIYRIKLNVAGPRPCCQ